MSDAAIAAEIARRLGQISTGLGITAELDLPEQARIAFGGMSRFMRISDDSEPVIDLSQCSPNALDQLIEVQVEAFLDGQGEEARRVRRIKFKPMDKQRVLEALSRRLGRSRIPGPTPRTAPPMPFATLWMR